MYQEQQTYHPQDVASFQSFLDNDDTTGGVWSFDEFIQFDVDDQSMLQVPPLTSPPFGRRRSSSVHTPFTNPLSLSHSPVSSVETTSPPHAEFWMDLDHLVIPPTTQEEALISQKRRRRSSSLPPSFNKHQEVVFAPIQVAADSRPSMMMKPSVPIQIQRLHRNRIPPATPEQLRQAMDKRLNSMNFNDVTVAELKQMLRHYGQSTTGRKVELIERLQQERDRLLNQPS
ncbi:hypothetical protein BJV82DRAFT_580288 [Fennellomyces sp. T-0311]|nr:hypothetical protein BJV82DRAFT_580288 [Fennellomyces sp. T-0311]